jgi:hypothetical protein
MADIKSKLLLDNSQFNRNAKESTRLTGTLKKGLSAVGGAAKFAAAGFTAAAAGLTFFVTRSTQYIDRLGKVSKTTGFAAETLQKFQFAAEQSGVTSDNAALALRRFSRRLGEAQRGTGELLPALKKLGIETRDNTGTLKSAEQVLFEFANGISKSRNESEQLSLAFKAFDSEGAELVETLKDGAEGLQAFFDEAESLGFILNQQSIRGVEDFADEFNRLQKIVQGLINQFTAALAPTLENITKRFRDFIQLKISEAGGLEAFGKFLKDKFIKILVTFVQVLETTTNFIIEFANAIVLLARKAGEKLGIEVFESFTTGSKEAKDEYEAFKDAVMSPLGIPSNDIKAILDNLEALGYEVGELQKRFEEVGQFKVTFSKFNEEGAALRKDVLDFVNQLEAELEAKALNLFEKADFSSFIKMLLGDLEENKKAAQETVEMIEEVVVKGQNKIGETLLGKIFGVGPVKQFWEDWYTAGDDAMRRLGAIGKMVLGEELINAIRDAFAASDVGDYVKTLAEGLVKGVEMFEDALADAIVTGKADFSSLADHLKQVLAKAMVQKFITGPIMALFGLASGGPAKAGQPYIVGEEGPELFIPKASGTVIPHGETMAMMNSGGTAMGMGGTVNYNINAVDAPSFQQLVARDPEFIYNVSRAGARRTPA